MHFDLNMLAVLAHLLRTQSVTMTADRLGVSQPSVSRALARLRELFNDPLLVRTARGMEPTRRAEQLLEPLQQWLASGNALLSQPGFDPAKLTRRFRVASTDFGVSAVLGPALPAIHQQAPGAAIDVQPLSADILTRLAAGEVDLVISGLDSDPSLAHERYLFTEGFSCVLSPQHPLANKPADVPLTTEEFLAFPHISMVVSDIEFDRINMRLGKAAERRRILARLPYFHTAPHIIGASDAIMTLPDRSALPLVQSHGLRCRKAPDLIGTFDYKLLWHERAHRDPAINWLCDMMSVTEEFGNGTIHALCA